MAGIVNTNTTKNKFTKGEFENVLDFVSFCIDSAKNSSIILQWVQSLTTLYSLWNT